MYFMLYVYLYLAKFFSLSLPRTYPFLPAHTPSKQAFR